jgi:hypothetical protein
MRVDVHVAALGPAQFGEPLPEGCNADLPFRIVREEVREHADTPHPLALLCPRRDWPRRRRAAKQDDEVAPSYT